MQKSAATGNAIAKWLSERLLADKVVSQGVIMNGIISKVVDWFSDEKVVKRCNEEAAKYFKLAVETGNSDAQWCLGELYQEGRIPFLYIRKTAYHHCLYSLSGTCKCAIGQHHDGIFVYRIILFLP